MSLIIKGIDLPKKGTNIVLTIYGRDGTYYARTYPSGSRIKDEAIQIPEDHGRLIDASELIKSYMRGTKTGIDDFYDTIDIIDNAPTILEAER